MSRIFQFQFAILLLLAFTPCLYGQSPPTTTDSSTEGLSSCPTIPQLKKESGTIDILSSTQGVNFGPYLSRIAKKIRKIWYKLIPEEVQDKSGKVSIEFAVLKDGKVEEVKGVQCTGDLLMDYAAWNAIIQSSPLPSLPTEFRGESIVLRFNFYYSPPTS